MLIITAQGLYLSFMAVCVMLALMVHVVSWFDLRSAAADAWPVSRFHGEEDDPARLDLVAMAVLLMLAGLGFLAAIGWWIPVLIETHWGIGRFSIAPVDLPLMGRLAQVIGLGAFAAIALRLVPVMITFGAICLIAGGAWAAIDHIFQLGFLAAP